MKVPTPEEVLALVTAATAPDGTMEPAMQQLLMQVQEQQARVQALAAAPGEESSPALIPAPSTVEDAATAPIKAAKSDGATPMDLMPLSAAAVVIGSPISGAVGAVSAVAPAPTTSTSTAVKRKSIPLSMKKEAIEWIMGPGKGIPSRAEKHFGALNWDVSASSFRKWWKNREKILGDSGSKKRITGGGRKPYLEDSEEKLLVVVIQERAKKDRVTRKWIAKTAQHMFQRSNASFKASENWVTKFIRRNGLTLKRSYVTYEPQPPVDHHQAAASAAAAQSAAATATK
ncbi:hypothetical protein BBJ28_00001035 [Nothophytophthora sp. Chile5]|nr:hypothetical protein BBJ28_00001035 [Nothophytophthora sp. Chile5]